MLIDFHVSNYRSFDKDASFSMEAGKIRNFSDRIAKVGNERILKFKAFFGPNASGKSNIVKALRFMRSVVLSSKIPARSATHYCRINPDNRDLPSIFMVNLIIEKKHYEYGFEVLLSKGSIVREWLIEKKSQRDHVLFDINQNFDIAESFAYIRSANMRERLRIYAEDIAHNRTVLFLHEINQNKASLYSTNPEISVFQAVYKWFENSLHISLPDEPIMHYGYFMDSDISSEAVQILKSFDTGITGIEFCDEPIEKARNILGKDFFDEVIDELQKTNQNVDGKSHMKRSGVMLKSNEGRSMYLFELQDDDIICKTLKLQHEHINDLFSLSEESDGTVRLIDLIEVLLVNKPGCVYVIDEISRCLHPTLTNAFISTFLSLAQQRDIQLIITTHEVELLNLKLVRQDEVALVQKDQETGSSTISGLQGVRFDTRLRKAYLDGEFKAIPVIEGIQHVEQDE